MKHLTKALALLLCAVMTIGIVPLSALAAGNEAAAFNENSAADSFILGDTDGDETIAAADARLALRASVGLESFAPDSPQFTAADADQDGVITADDARLILRASVGTDQIRAKGPALDVCFADNDETWKDYRNPELFRAYYAQVLALLEKCGHGTVSEAPYSGKCLDGLSVVRLIDMDRDGRPELYCAYSDNDPLTHNSNRQAIYRFRNHTVETLYDDSITNRGSDFSPMVRFNENEGEIHFIAWWLFERYYYTLENGSLQGLKVEEDIGMPPYVNGELWTMEQYETLLNRYLRNGVTVKIDILDLSDNAAANYSAVLQETEAVISLLGQ